jgi:hypothetical protein
MKKSHVLMSVFLLVALLAVQLAACTTKPDISTIQTAVAGTLAAAPAQPGKEVTQLVEVTRVVEVKITVAANAELTKPPTATVSPSATQTATQNGTQPTAVQDTATPVVNIQPGAALGWSLQFFVSRYSSMTNLQMKDFATSLPGKRVSWYALLENITYDGLVIMKFPYGMKGFILLHDVPVETAVRINRGDQVEFSGMIESFDIDTNYLVLKNVKIIDFYIEPTPTITPTPTPITPTPPR